ncbi:DUF2550 family protein [Mobilicoccus sp.]|uniref:DUF2550 family protein n=1 Tax=Mobilicoccus sp. TaxID=2034349 RepID=UPI0028A65E5F|nr:DUF2550 family protein [Mobilicoccus sp.]
MDTSALTIVEVVLVGLVLLAAAAVLSVYVRRRLISHDSDVVSCGFRPGRTGRWRPSLLRMSATSLQVFPLFGWSVRPSFSWTRRSVDLGVVTTLEDEAMANAFDVQGRGRKVAATAAVESGDPMQFDLALGLLSYTALRYWVESAPPATTWHA